MCIAADSGIDHARALGLVPDLAVGDFDSVTPAGLDWAIAHGTTLERHPAAKAETDLELALHAAAATRPDRVVVAAIGGGRVDHLLANLALIADARFAAMPVEGMIDSALLTVVHDRRELTGTPDELVSLVPMHGDALGVTTEGLGYPLADEPLTAGAGRGVSNYFTHTDAAVSVRSGTLLAIQPHRLLTT